MQYFFTGACWVFFSWDILVSQLTVGYTAIINSIFNISSHDLMCNRSRKKVHLAQSFLLPQPVLGFYRRVCSVPLSEYIPSHVLLKGSANARCSSMIWWTFFLPQMFLVPISTCINFLSINCRLQHKVVQFIVFYEEVCVLWYFFLRFFCCYSFSVGFVWFGFFMDLFVCLWAVADSSSI